MDTAVSCVQLNSFHLQLRHEHLIVHLFNQVYKGNNMPPEIAGLLATECGEDSGVRSICLMPDEYASCIQGKS